MPEILYEDRDIIVCVKPSGILSESENGDSICSMLEEHLKEENNSGKTYLVHRLDRATGGLMVFAKNSKSAAALSNQISQRSFKKEYLAAIHGCPLENQGTFEDLLFKDSLKNKSFVVKRMRKGVKSASLDYSVLKTVNSNYGEISLVKILLNTGRTHQIRVQFSSRKMPLLGDGKYGGSDNGCPLGLWSYSMTFKHPKSGEEMYFVKEPENNLAFDLFDTK